MDERKRLSPVRLYFTRPRVYCPHTKVMNELTNKGHHHKWRLKANIDCAVRCEKKAIAGKCANGRKVTNTRGE